jgi:Leucine-rich repeat (LRR) protein
MIDLRNNLKLTGLRLSSNQLRQIDLRNHTNLSEIYLNANKLTRSIICYLPKLNADLADQAVESCVLRLVHTKVEGEECRKWGEAKVQFYNKKRDYNKHDCQYSIQTIERE